MRFTKQTRAYKGNNGRNKHTKSPTLFLVVKLTDNRTSIIYTTICLLTKQIKHIQKKIDKRTQYSDAVGLKINT